MKKQNIVYGNITIKMQFNDVFSEDWDEEDIIAYIRQNLDDYIDWSSYELEDIEVEDIEKDNYGGDDLYGI